MPRYFQNSRYDRQGVAHGSIDAVDVGKRLGATPASRLSLGRPFIFARIAAAEIPPLALVLYRASIATLVLHLWLRMRGISFSPVRARPFPVPRIAQ
jgi:hypothetical protein